MSRKALRIVTRESPLAMWQACHVRDRLIAAHPDLEIQILGIKTEADRFLDNTLASLGGKGAFVKELEQALLADQADLAVHSMKDVTVDLPDGLGISAILAREDPGDALISSAGLCLADLPEGSIVGTSSLRRQCQLKAYRSDLVIKDIRGNVGTRLKKLDNGDYDALVLASSGLTRLELDSRVTEKLDRKIMLPAIGQGALGIETRLDDPGTRDLISALDDEDTSLCVRAERSVNRQLNGGCHAPIGAYAVRDRETIALSALVGRLDGTGVIRAELAGPLAEAEEIGLRVGQMLLDKGAGDILDQLRADGSL